MIEILLILVLSIFEVCAHVLVSIRLLNVVGVNRDVGKSYHILMASHFANALTPFKAGIPTRVIYYQKIFGLHPGKGTGLVLIETVLLLASISIVAAIGMLLFFKDRNDVSPLLLIAILAVSFLSFLLVSFLLKKYLAKKDEIPVLKKLTIFLTDAKDSIKRVELSEKTIIVLLFIASLVLQGMRLSLALSLFSVPSSPLALASAITISYAVGVASLLPFGIGVRDGTLALLLSALGMNAAEVGIAVVCQRLFSPGIHLLFGSYSFYKLLTTYPISFKTSDVSSSNQV